uniref:Reverse transcriptase domain-containing protein n=1 Tax=Haemonchus contortus TaxID=6289 RepID=A0A7I4Z3P4_HAECO
MVRAVVKLKLKKIRSTPFARPFAVEKLKDPDLASRVALEMRNRFDALEEITNLEDEWTAVRDTIKVCAEEVVGRRRGKRKEEWIKDSTWQKIDERKYAKLQREQAKTSRELEEAKRRYTELDRLVKKSCRDDKNDCLIRKGAEAQYAADHGDSKTLYRIVRELTGNRNNSNVPIRDKNGRLLSNSDEQNQKWLEYFRDILNQPSPSTTYCFDNTDPGEQLEVNTGYITEEAGNTVVVEKLVKLFNRCWSQGEVPEDWRRGVIVKIPKKGNLSDCGIWRGITLLSVPGKTLCTALLRRICTAIDGRLREEQAGFRSRRSCSEQIFTLRNIIEQCVEYCQPLVINFVDFKKAFDSIHRESLWAILKIYGVPQSFISIFKNLYLNSSCCVRTDTGYTSFFQIDTGVRQGCILSPILFNVCLDFVMRETMKEVRTGISWHDRSRLTDLDFADDIALLAEDENKLQQVTTCLSREASMIGLRISACKSKVMKVGFDQTQLNISVDDTILETVGNFTYLGSTITHNGDAEMEVRIRIATAAVFRRLQPLWASSSISQNIKLRLYYSIVIPTALYASETWKRTASLVKRLNAFHQRCLRRIMKIRYTDHVTNEEVLRRCGSNCLHVVVAQRRLRLAGHILRMAQQRVSRVVMNWIPPEISSPDVLSSTGGTKSKSKSKSKFSTLQLSANPARFENLIRFLPSHSRAFLNGIEIFWS